MVIADHTIITIAAVAAMPLLPVLSVLLPGQLSAVRLPSPSGHGLSTGQHLRPIVLRHHTGPTVILSPGHKDGTVTVHANSVPSTREQEHIAAMTGGTISVMHHKLAGYRMASGAPAHALARCGLCWHKTLFIKLFEYLLPKCYRGLL